MTNIDARKDAKEYSASEARQNFSDLFDTAYFGTRVYVKKRDRCVALVSMEFIERVERLLEMEAEIEAEAAKIALQEFQSKGGKTMEQIKAELEMD